MASVKTRYDGGRDLRQVIGAMVTDPEVLAPIAAQWTDEGMFGNQDADMVASWCVKHWLKYGQPPNGRMRSIFDRKTASSEMSDDSRSRLEQFLTWVDEQGVDRQNRYLLEVAENLIKVAQLRRLRDKIDEDLERWDPDSSFIHISRLNPVDLREGKINNAGSEDIWKRASDPERVRPLLTYQRELGEFFYGAFVRGTLMGVLAPDKTGKSFWLQDIAFRAVRNRCRVAYFDAGDLSIEEIYDRMGQRASLRPLSDMTVRWPVSWDSEGELQTEERELDGLIWSEKMRAWEKVCRGDVDKIRFECYSSGTLRAVTINSVLERWNRRGWVADVVIIDYADIMAMPKGFKDSIDWIDELWKQLRRISQDRKCLVVVATQTNAAAYQRKGKTLGKGHFSGRKTKNAHVNEMFAINCSDQDKEFGINRLNWVVRRSRRYQEGRQILVAGCLDVACPSLISRFNRKKGISDEEDD